MTQIVDLWKCGQGPQGKARCAATSVQTKRLYSAQSALKDAPCRDSRDLLQRPVNQDETKPASLRYHPHSSIAQSASPKRKKLNCPRVGPPGAKMWCWVLKAMRGRSVPRTRIGQVLCESHVCTICDLAFQLLESCPSSAKCAVLVCMIASLLCWEWWNCGIPQQ